MNNFECDVSKCRELERELLKDGSCVSTQVIGCSTLGRRISAYTIGGEGGVLLCGTFHSMERITATMLYRFLQEVCDKCSVDAQLNQSLQKSGVTVIPMLNPDGVMISLYGARRAQEYEPLVRDSLDKAQVSHTYWQANARGVDLNHNFDAGYNEVKEKELSMGIDAPAPSRYSGECAFSEQETQLLRRFCINNNFKAAMALHTQGREIYYDFGKNTPGCSLQMAKDMAQLSGYTVSHPQGIAVGGGFKDWFIEYFGRPAFTLEIGLGKNPLPPSVFESEYPVVSEMLWYLIGYYTTKNSDE